MVSNKTKEKLTVKKLLEMPASSVFASDVIVHPDLCKEGRIQWTAVRGGSADWVIYYVPKGDPEAERKIITDPYIIQSLVPCTGTALGRYRFS